MQAIGAALSVLTAAMMARTSSFSADAFCSSPRVVIAPIVTAATSSVLSLPRGGGGRGGGVRGGAMRLNSSAATSSANDEDSPSKSGGGEQTIALATFNLIKGAVGAGVLSLPAGVAAIGDVPRA